MLVLATLMLTTSLALAEDAAPTPYTGPTAEQIASAMVEAEELRRPPEPKSAGVSASGFRLFGMNTVSGYRRWGLVEELELQLSAGVSPLLVMDEASLDIMGAGMSLGTDLGLFLHGHKFNGRKWVQQGFALEAGPSFNLVSGYPSVGFGLGMSYKKRIFRPDGKRSMAWQLGGRGFVVPGLAEEVGGGLLLAFSWDKQQS
jgi:hypothetical protein